MVLQIKAELIEFLLKSNMIVTTDQVCQLVHSSKYKGFKHKPKG